MRPQGLEGRGFFASDNGRVVSRCPSDAFSPPLPPFPQGLTAGRWQLAKQIQV